MFKSLRARLWIGYSLLILLVIGAFFIGLFVTLNRSSALYRQSELQMRLEEQTLLTKIEQNPGDTIQAVSTSLVEKPPATAMRVWILDNLAIPVYDSQSGSGPSIQWRNLAIRRAANNSSVLMIRDSKGKVWIYISRKLIESNQFLVIATLRGNLTLKFMLSDPMILLIFKVLIFSILVSILLTILMDHWIAAPIRKMSKTARTMAVEGHKDLPLEGPKEVQDLADSINQMNRQVKESQQSQRDFVSDVSHELKTPLTSIQGFANAVLDGTANDERSIKHAAQVIISESERMLRLVVDLLTLTRLEGGVESLSKTPINLNVLIVGIVEKMLITAGESRIKIINSVQVLPLVNADTDRITQVLTNLIDNAIKYSNPGGEVILMSNFDSKTVRIQVVDHGIGISSANLSKIFNRFYQVDKSRTGGMRRSAGLGLPIARQIARAHGGDILVTSELGRGTTFTLVLPVTIIR
jgi:signal transduction histidine kinase